MIEARDRDRDREREREREDCDGKVFVASLIELGESLYDDKTCPIDLDKIDVNYLIRALQDLKTNKKMDVHCPLIEEDDDEDEERWQDLFDGYFCQDHQ